MSLPSKEDVVAEIALYADSKLGGKITAGQISEVLKAIVFYINEPEKVKDWQKEDLEMHKFVGKAGAIEYQQTMRCWLQYKDEGVMVKIECQAL